jgi:nucleoid-associated protein YgaU
VVADNEYLVVKGDNLKKIAGLPNVLNDPTKWTKLYEANKDVIRNDHMLYPNQILIIPKE